MQRARLYLCRMSQRLLEMAVVHAWYGISLLVIAQYWTKVITLIFSAENHFLLASLVVYGVCRRDLLSVVAASCWLEGSTRASRCPLLYPMIFETWGSEGLKIFFSRKIILTISFLSLLEACPRACLPVSSCSYRIDCPCWASWEHS